MIRLSIGFGIILITLVFMGYYYYKIEKVFTIFVYRDAMWQMAKLTRSEAYEMLSKKCAPGKDLEECNKAKKLVADSKGFDFGKQNYLWFVSLIAFGISTCISAFFIKKKDKLLDKNNDNREIHSFNKQD
jgi:hypothetical protein